MTPRRILVAAALVVALAAGAILVVTYREANDLVGNSPAERAAFLRDRPELAEEAMLAGHPIRGLREVTLVTEDGVRLAGRYAPGEDGRTVVLVHGYTDPATEMVPIASMLAEHGIGVFLVHLRAHGDSEGELITFGKHELADLRAAMDWVVAQPEVDPERIAMIGNSMGAALAILYAPGDPRVRGVIAHSPYASIDDTIEVSVKKFTGLPSFPFAPLIVFFIERKLDLDIDTVAPIAVIDRISPRPVLVMASGADTYTNPEGGRKLYEAAREPKELWYDSRTEHVEFQQDHPREFERRVLQFLGHAFGPP